MIKIIFEKKRYLFFLSNNTEFGIDSMFSNQNLYLDQNLSHLHPMFRLHFHCHPPPQIHRAQNHYNN